MNNTVKTSNILLSRNFDILIQLIKGFIKKEALQNSDIVSIESNQSNFISLTHDFAYGQSGGAKTHQIVIELTDTDNKFNEKFILASLKKMSVGDRKDLGSIDSLNYEALEALKEEAEKSGDFGYVETIYKNGGAQDLPVQFIPDPRVENFKEFVEVGPTIPVPLGGDQLKNPFAHIFTEIEEEKQKGIDILKKANIELSGIINSQIVSLKADITTTQMFIMYGVGPNYDSWAGPFMCNLTNVEYKFNGSTGSKSIELTFTPFGSAAMLTGDNVFRNGLGLLVTDVKSPIFENKKDSKTFAPNKDTLPKGPTDEGDIPFFGLTIAGDDIFKFTPNSTSRVWQNSIGFIESAGSNIKEVALAAVGVDSPKRDTKADDARTSRLVGKWNEFIQTIPQTRHSVVKSLVYQYLKKATVDMDILVLLPDIDKVTEKQYQILRNQASKYIRGHSTKEVGSNINPGQRGFFYNAYSLIEIYRSLGLSIISSNQGKEFKGTNVPGGFAEEFGTYLGDNSIKDTSVSLLKYPDQTFRQPLDNLMKTIASNGYPIEFEIEIIHNSFYFSKLAEIMKSNGRTDITGTRPVLLVGDRAMFHKFVFGKKSLEDAGIIKYVPLGGDRNKAIPLDNLLEKEDQVFLSPEYIKLAKDIFHSSSPEYPYDFDTLPTDQYYFKDIEKTNTILKETGVTVFRLGTENANVLDINSNLSMAYFTALRQIWYSETYNGRYHSGGVNLLPGNALNPHSSSPEDNRQALNSINILDPNTLADKVRELNGDESYGGQGAIANQLGITNQQLDDIVAYSVNLLSYANGSRGISIPVGWESGDSAFIQLIRLLNIVNRSASMATVKTLPAFHLSDCTHSLPTVLLILSEPGAVGKSNDFAVLNTLSGFWRIVGFQHKVSNYDSCSSFHLAKDFSSGMPVLLDMPTKKEAL